MKFIPPIHFPVIIAGEKQTAYVIEQLGKQDQFILRIRFTDGFEDFFYLDVDGDVYSSTEKGIIYEQSIRSDIRILIGLDSKRFYHVLEGPVDGVPTNVWIIELNHEVDKSRYGIYYDNACRYEVVREQKRWRAFTRAAINSEINQRLIKRVTKLLDKLFLLIIAIRFG